MQKARQDFESERKEQERIKNLLLAKGRKTPSANHFNKFMKFPFFEY